MQIIQKNRLEVESDWQKELAKSFKDPESLMSYLDISAHAHAHHFGAKRLFAMLVPRFFASLMEKGNIKDPLLQQVMPLENEFLKVPGFNEDPLQEQGNETTGLLHKYKNRVLLIIRGGCAVNCRYCFRRHFPYQDNQLNKRQFEQTVSHIENDPQIDEVIFSGGDPLMAKDSHLGYMASRIAQIPHIKRLRIHTRLPVVLPSRIDEAFCDWLSASALQTIIVLHINHANEVSPQLSQAVSKLVGLGVRVLNQSVLLRGVNDSVETQMALNEALFNAGIQPYYLHLLDKVSGAAHFDVSEQQARQIMQAVVANQSGYMIPKLVREIAGQASKTPVDLHLPK